MTLRKPEISLYSDLISEVKYRYFLINEIEKNLIRVHPQILRETIHAQLRICCELVALALVVAHKNIDANKTSEIFKKYKPNDIFTRLEKSHPKFYPQPFSKIKTEEGWHFDDFNEARSHYLSKEELKKIWTRSGDHLHRGSLHSVISGKKNVASTTYDFNNEMAAFREFLSSHIVFAHDKSYVIICEGNLEMPSDPVRCWIATPKTEEQQPH